MAELENQLGQVEPENARPTVGLCTPVVGYSIAIPMGTIPLGESPLGNISSQSGGAVAVWGPRDLGPDSVSRYT